MIKSDNIKKGRFDWRTNKIFSDLLELNKKSSAAVMEDFVKMTGTDKAASMADAERGRKQAAAEGKCRSKQGAAKKRAELEL